MQNSTEQQTRLEQRLGKLEKRMIRQRLGLNRVDHHLKQLDSGGFKALVAAASTSYYLLGRKPRQHSIHSTA